MGIKSLSGLLKNLLKGGSNQFTAKERAIGLHLVFDQIWNSLADLEDWASPVDIFFDPSDGSIFTVVNQEGRLFMIPITVESGGEVMMGEWSPVQMEFGAERSFSVQRQLDGKYRWLAVAATSVLNRVTEIDSTSLFDSFIEEANRTGAYPRVDFYHLGGQDPETWEFGTADYLARDGVVYVASGTFDESHPLAKAVIAAAERGDSRWGTSIEFRAIGDSQIINVDPEIRVPVYHKGVNTRISVVLEKDAAGLFTRIGVSKEATMDRSIMDKLKELFGQDEEALEEFASKVDGINRTVAEEGLIHRSTEEDSSPTEPEEISGEEVEEMAELSLEIGEEEIGQIAEAVIATERFNRIEQAATSLVGTLEELRNKFENLETQLTAALEENSKLRSRVSALEEDEGLKKEEWLQDLPQTRKMKVTYRPRTARGPLEDPETGESYEEDYGQIAEKALRNLPSY